MTASFELPRKHMSELYWYPGSKGFVVTPKAKKIGVNEIDIL